MTKLTAVVGMRMFAVNDCTVFNLPCLTKLSHYLHLFMYHKFRTLKAYPLVQILIEMLCISCHIALGKLCTKLRNEKKKNIP